MSRPPLLIELVTEELPPLRLRALAESFAKELAKNLSQGNFLSANSTYEYFATPRRIAFRINDVLLESLPVRKIAAGPAVSKAFDAQGKPTAALLGFAKKQGVTTDALERLHDGKQEIFVHRAVPKGTPLREVLEALIRDALDHLPIAKLMNYQRDEGETTVRFVRPAHRFIVLHGTEVVPCRVLGITAGRITEGHRFQNQHREITLAHAEEYEQKLQNEGAVIANFERRRAEIDKQLRHETQKIGATLGIEENVAALLEEVTALVEWPAVYLGTFDSEFLQVPQECLVLTMRAHQKYFPLYDADGRLLNKFLMVANLRPSDPKNIIEGNQRVIRPRLADARFFYETDNKTSLAERVPQLAHIVYHNKLGSQLDRIHRLRKLGAAIAQKLDVDVSQVQRAAHLCKADLLTHMVGEFPELQGVMGEYYALNEGEPATVARAIREHYYPRFANDVLPADNVGASIALADKLEALAGIFGIGNRATGDKDPFALRRHALGLIRLLIELDLPLSLHELINEAFSVFPTDAVGKANSDMTNFIFERLRGYLRDKGYTANEIEAVLYVRPFQLSQLPRQLAAVREFMRLPEAESLVAANKRVVNLLKQAQVNGESFSNAEIAELKDPVEHELFRMLKTASDQADVLFEQGDYGGYLKAFAVLKTPVDSFFNSVMIMTDDDKLRQNRLALLTDLREAMNRVADISKLAA